MTREEFSKLVKGMKAVYSDPKFIPDKDAFEVWYSMLMDMEYRVASDSIQRYMLTNKFPPTIADIREQSIVKNVDTLLTDSEAWSLVYKAICKSNYNSEEEFEKLPEMIKKAVGSPSQLRTWASDSEFNEGVISSNFKKTYRVMLEREKEDLKLPQAIKDRLAMNNQNLIGSANEE